MKCGGVATLLGIEILAVFYLQHLTEAAGPSQTGKSSPRVNQSPSNSFRSEKQHQSRPPSNPPVPTPTPPNLSNVRTSETGCEGEFLYRCRCGNQTYEGRYRFVTNCTDTGFTDTAILAQIPIETEILIFVGNHLPSLPPNVFGDENTYDRLEEIDLSRNGIVEIRGQAFHRIPALKKLSLNFNRWHPGNYSRLFANLPKLEELQLNGALRKDGVVSGGDGSSFLTLMNYFNRTEMPRLSTVRLENNEIGPVLQMEPFCELPALERLFLSNNSIQFLDWSEDCFHHRLTYLNLSANVLRRLTNHSTEILDQLGDAKVDMSDNDFVCDCNMVDFYNWLHNAETNVINKENYVCMDAYPELNTGKKILDLQEEELKCPQLLLLLPPSSFNVAHVALIFIIVVMVSLLSVVAYTNRRIISLNLRRAGEPLYRRMQYSTINKQQPDEQEMEV